MFLEITYAKKERVFLLSLLLKWNPDITIFDITIIYVPAKVTVKCMGENPDSDITIFDITVTPI